jgi:DNA-binding CsgD family transcriptional regulator
VDSESGVHDTIHYSTLDSLADSASLASLALEAVNALGTGIAILDGRARVLFANLAGARLQRKHTVFKTIPPLPLVLCETESNEALRTAITTASQGASTALQMRDDESHPVINAVVLPLHGPRWISSDARPVVLLAMNELERPGLIPDRWLSRLFGLTPTESWVTNWLVAGRTIDEYAQRRGVSLETARSQLKTILSKTGMSRQAQLVAALLRLPTEYVSHTDKTAT